MSAPSDIGAELAELRRDIRYLQDRADILDCVNRHARGCDRHDVDLISSTYHQDGVDEHGNVVNPRARIWRVGERVSRCNVPGAHAQHHHARLRDRRRHRTRGELRQRHPARQRRSHRAIHQRPISRPARTPRRNWRITLRRSTVEVMFVADASVLQSSFFRDLGYVKGVTQRAGPLVRSPAHDRGHRRTLVANAAIRQRHCPARPQASARQMRALDVR